MKKKVLAAIMTGAMLLSLAACGAKEQAPAETPEQGKTAEDTQAPAEGENASGGETIKIGRASCRERV